MRYLYGILKHHIKNDADRVSILLVFLFTSVFVFLQYQHHLVRDVIRSYPYLQRVPLYFLLFSAIFCGSCAILIARKRIPNIFRVGKFWLVLFLGFVINSFDQSYYLLGLVKGLNYSSTLYKEVAASIATHSVSLFSVILPLALIYRFDNETLADRSNGFLGLTFKKELNLRPYFLVLGLMLLVIGLSTFSSGIGSYYPVYKRSALVQYAGYLGLSKGAALAIFEFFYATDFISVELLFRGFLIFAFAPLLGKHVMLPVAACYMVFHFGKPLAETISSFFGGYLLGVFAYYTRNIWGGVIVHIGTALFMELIASFI